MKRVLICLSTHKSCYPSSRWMQTGISQIMGKQSMDTKQKTGCSMGLISSSSVLLSITEMSVPYILWRSGRWWTTVRWAVPHLTQQASTEATWLQLSPCYLQRPYGSLQRTSSFRVLVTHRRKPRNPGAGYWLNVSTRSEGQAGSPCLSPRAARISCLTQHPGRSVSAEHGGAPRFHSLLTVAADPTGGYSEVPHTRLRPALVLAHRWGGGQQHGPAVRKGDLSDVSELRDFNEIWREEEHLFPHRLFTLRISVTQ